MDFQSFTVIWFPVSIIIILLLIKCIIDQKKDYDTTLKNIAKSLRKSINDISKYAEKEK